jgi:hypothetical protein
MKNQVSRFAETWFFDHGVLYSARSSANASAAGAGIINGWYVSRGASWNSKV